MRRRVVYVTYDGLLEPLGASQVVPYVVGLAARGHSMHIVSFEKADDVGRATDLARVHSHLQAQGVGWTRLPYHRRPTLPATAWDIQVGRSTLRALHAEDPIALVHARSYVAGAMALGLRSARVPFLFDMRGFWIDERLESGRWTAGSPALVLARRLERTLLAEAAGIVHLTHRGLAAVEELGAAPTPLQRVVPTCVDLGRYAPAVRADGAAGGAPMLVHAGTLTGWYRGRETFEVGRSFVRGGGRFVVLTRDREAAEVLARETGTSAEIHSVPPSEMPDWLARADAGIALLRASPSKRASAPTRIGEYLASGLAVAVSSGVGDLDAQLGGSSVVRMQGPQIDAEETASWLLGASRATGRSREARDLARRHFDLEEGVRILSDTYQDLGAPPCM